MAKKCEFRKKNGERRDADAQTISFSRKTKFTSFTLTSSDGSIAPPIPHLAKAAIICQPRTSMRSDRAGAQTPLPLFCGN